MKSTQSTFPRSAEIKRVMRAAAIAATAMNIDIGSVQFSPAGGITFYARSTGSQIVASEYERFEALL